MNIELALGMFVPLMVLIFLGVPVAFALMTVAICFGLPWFGTPVIHLFVAKVQDLTSNHILAALPLFVFMGAMLERSGIAAGLFNAIALWVRRIPGGLAVGTIVMCVLFAASSGAVGATETVVGMLAIPVMLRSGYDRGLISGTICAGGSLGSMIPPSVLVIILALIAEIGIGELFAGMMIPGLLLAGLYIAYIIVRCTLRSADAPKPDLLSDGGDPSAFAEVSFGHRLRITSVALVPPLALILAVLGSIVGGIAVATEAAAAGAVGAVILTVAYGNFSLAVLRDAAVKALSITAMILTVLLGGLMFSGVFIPIGGLAALEHVVDVLGLGAWGTLIAILAITFIAGFVLDVISIILIVVPVALPLLGAYGFDALWFCILLLVVLQTSLLTPPMAGAIFYLRAVAPPEITLRDMYRGVVPFVALHFVVLGLVLVYPKIALWLPSTLLG